MKQLTFHPEYLIKRLEFYKIRFTHEPAVFKIYFPILCFLKVKYKTGSVKISSHIYYGFSFLSIEYNILIYALISYYFASGQWLSSTVMALAGASIIIILFVSLIKLELFKYKLMSWIEQDQ